MNFSIKTRRQKKMLQTPLPFLLHTGSTDSNIRHLYSRGTMPVLVLEDSNNESSVNLAKINYSKIANSALGKTAVTSWIIRPLASNFHH